MLYSFDSMDSCFSVLREPRIVRITRISREVKLDQGLEAVSILPFTVAELARVLTFPVPAGSLATSATVLKTL